MLTLYWCHFSRFIVGLCFLTSRKEEYSEVTAILLVTDLFKRDVFRLYRDWNKLMINQVIALFVVQLTINLTRGNLRS